MNQSKTVHSHAYDTIIDLSVSDTVAKAMQQLAYIPAGLSRNDLERLRVSGIRLFDSEQLGLAALNPASDEGIALQSSTQRSILFLYQDDRAAESADFDFLKDFIERSRQIFPAAYFGLMIFSGECAGVCRGEGILHIKSKQDALLKTIRAHIEKTLKSRPDLHRELMIKRGALIDTGTYQARRVGHRFGEDYALVLGEAVEYCIEHRGVNFELYAKLKADSDVLVVFGQSAVTKGANNTPVFHRWSWADDLPYSVLVLNDPTLYLDPQILGGWFQGTADHYYMETMAQIVGQFARQLNIPNPRILWFGSSAGGFSSMMMALTLRGSHALVQIPQVDMSRYSIQSSVDDLCTYCYGGLPIEEVMAQYGARMSVIEAFRAARYVPNIWYLQNTQDQNHLLRHYATFVEGIARLMIDLPEVRGADVLLELYDILNPVRGGHTVMNKPDTLAYIHRAVERFILQPAGQRAG